MTQSRIIPLAERPDLEQLAARFPARYPFLLKSVSNDESSESADILFARPTGELRLRHAGGRWQLLSAGDAPVARHDDFLIALNDWFAALGPPPACPHPLPFRGGWFIYLGYELARQIEPGLELPVSDGQTVALAARVPVAVVNCRGPGARSFVIAEPGFDSLADRALADCAAIAGDGPDDDGRAGKDLNLAIDEDPADTFTRAVASALELIGSGDIYQANLSRRWQAACPDGAAPALFAALNRANPAPFAALARLGDLSIVSSSPERLVRTRGTEVATRPIAGTRPRGGDADDDRRLLAELRAHPKEQAEHVMLIDLERNDLGRVCRAGSVHVDEFMGVESYAFVHHIVSNITGQLRDDVLPGDVIRAVFPGGTITGCPKVRCMEIIAELEGVPRSAYTGSLGYLNRDGDMDLNILIRTLLLADGTLSFRTGAGIVADSLPLAELAETRAKAEGLLRALREVGRCAG